jgi:hypothetical protein
MPSKSHNNWIAWGAKYYRCLYDKIGVTTITLGSWLNVECKGLRGQENVFGCETYFHKWERMQGMEPNDSQVHSHFGITFVRESWMFKTLVGKTNKIKLGPHDTIGKVLKCRCLKCPHIVHLYLICMNYDQKKGRESNWEFDSWSQIPLEQSSNLRLGHAIHLWKDLFESYKVVPLDVPNKLGLKKIWTSKILGQKKSQFSESQEKNAIWM